MTDRRDRELKTKIYKIIDNWINSEQFSMNEIIFAIERQFGFGVVAKKYLISLEEQCLIKIRDPNYKLSWIEKMVKVSKDRPKEEKKQLSDEELLILNAEEQSDEE